MQSIPHSMAHRGAGATRTNARWHPYTPPRAPFAGASMPNCVLLAPSTSHHQHQSISQEPNYLITPAASVYSISPAVSTFSQSPHPLSAALQQTIPFTLKQPQIQKTHQAKANYVASLVDQTVKSLTDIWRPEDIPAVFSTQTDITVLSRQSSLPCPRSAPKHNLVQLPSPCSPGTFCSPFHIVSSDPPRLSRSASTVFPAAFLAEHFGTNATTVVSEKDLVPIKTFVQEVLRRSRTTCSVLQSALCYIEAVRGKVPELLEKEKCGMGLKDESELDERIVKEEASLLPNSNSSTDTLSGLPTEVMPMDPFDGIDATTVLQKDASSLPIQTQPANNAQSNDKRRKIPAKPLTPLPPLPSPLLCPRRTFLAALILASKFLQDRCYSNRAWAKLSGLPPREVSRCERALGDALGWRLWVGKSPSSAPEENPRGVQRSKSEGTIAFGTSPRPTTYNTMFFPSPPLSDAGRG